jgi:hypothetical protein
MAADILRRMFGKSAPAAANLEDAVIVVNVRIFGQRLVLGILGSG